MQTSIRRVAPRFFVLYLVHLGSLSPAGSETPMSEKSLALAARRQQALVFAIEGKTGREIAAALNAVLPEDRHISASTAWRDVRSALSSQAKENEKGIDTYRELIGERYTRLLAKWLNAAETDPESKAGDKVLKVLEGLRQLYGLDRPVEKQEDEGIGFPTTIVINRRYINADAES